MKLASIKVESSKNEHKKIYFQVEWIFGLLTMALAQVFNGSK